MDQIAGEVTAAVSVDFMAKPSEKRLVVASVQGGLKIWQIPVGGLPELRAGEIAQSVGREITKAA